MSTKYGMQSPDSEFSNKDEHGGDESVSYVRGKRQHKMSNVEYKSGKMPRGEFHGRVVNKSPMMHTGK